MSHSQFHSTKLFILRHAWLNLWDKHMTTGRINQVTTFQNIAAAMSTKILDRPPRGPPFFRREFVLSVESISNPLGVWENVILCLTHKVETALFPDLTSSRRIGFFVCHNERNHGLLRELPCDPATANIYMSRTRPRWIPKCTSCIKLGHQQAVHIPSVLASSNHKKRVCLAFPSISTLWLGQFQISMPCKSQRRAIDSAQDEPAYPHQKGTKGILNLFQPSCKSPQYQRSLGSPY